MSKKELKVQFNSNTVFLNHILMLPIRKKMLKGLILILSHPHKPPKYNKFKTIESNVTNYVL